MSPVQTRRSVEPADPPETRPADAARPTPIAIDVEHLNFYYGPKQALEDITHRHAGPTS